MKTSISTEQQLNIWLRKTTDKHHVVRLRRNHEPFEKVGIDEEPTTYWRCDEIELRLPIQKNVEQYVEDNFNMLFDTWVNAQALFDIGE